MRPGYDPDLHHRRSIRLVGHDYSKVGSYFLTICTHDRECLFGDVLDGEMRANALGVKVQECWEDLPHHYESVVLDAFMIMPNHVHGIVILVEFVGAGLNSSPKLPARPQPLSEITRAFKTFSSRRINELRHSPGMPVWQRNYYEHVIRNQAEMDRIREYIIHNPGHWEEDSDNLTRTPAGKHRHG